MSVTKEWSQAATVLDAAELDGVKVYLDDAGSVQVDAPESAGSWRPRLEQYRDILARMLRGESLEDPPEDAPEPRSDRYEPFPTHLLPPPLDDLVSEAAKAIGCDPSYVALPLLSCAGSAIGNTTRLVVKKGWAVPPAIWTMIVGESGTAKSPAFKVAKAPIQRHQKQLLENHAQLLDEYQEALAKYETAMKEHKKSKSEEEPPEKPAYPHPQRVMVSDTTVEALAPILSSNARGLLLQRDELSGWLGSFNAYKSAKGADESAWLSMFDGESITVDRKGEGTRPTYVESALVSITGGIQPAILAKSMSREHRASGMASRFLIASPPRRAQSWTDHEISEATQLLVDRLFIKLLEIDFADGESVPHYVGMSAAAKKLFRQFFNDHHQEQADLTGDSAAAWSKLLGYVPRLALLFHVVGQCHTGGDIMAPVEASTVQAAIDLVTWFKREASRLYASIDDTDDDRELRELASWIDRRHQGECTPREIVQGMRSVADIAAAEQLCTQLVRSRMATWDTIETPSGTGPQKRVIRTL